jgi:hypothetical protein
MRLSKLFVGCVAAACLTASPAFAHRPPTPPPTGKPTTPITPSTQGSGKPTTTPSTSGATTGTTPPPLNPIAAKIVAKPQLNTKVTNLLKPTGMSLNDASNGFKNQGQFMAALHVSQNLGIPFKSLQHDMTTKKLSLGQSIQNLKKTADADKESEHAERQANDDLKETSGPKETDNDSHQGSRGSTPIVNRITHNPTLDAKVNALLPTGMSLKQAAFGFRSTEQFLAALHAAKNLGISFAQLQTEMTGKDRDTLSTAIHELKPSANATEQAQLANTQARQDLQSSKPATTGDTQ